MAAMQASKAWARHMARTRAMQLYVPAGWIGGRTLFLFVHTRAGRLAAAGIITTGKQV